MIFNGKGIVWNPIKNRQLVDFNTIKEYITHDKDEISILLECSSVQCVEGEEIQPEEIEINIPEVETDEIKDREVLTNQEIKDLLDEAGIEYRKKATKADLEKLLEGIENE